jgi:microcystin-dependent protein
MAYSYVVYTGDGVTTQFAVPFAYVREEHVSVEVNDVNTTFTWINGSTVEVIPAPLAGQEVLIKRTTPVAARLVDYTDGSTLVAADLDTDSLQHLFTEQELTDTVGGLEAFRGLYYGAYTADPILDPFGQVPSEGDLYFNTITKVIRVYSNAVWKDVTSDASLLRWVVTAAGGETSLSGFDINTRPLVYTPGLELVYLNGALLNRGTDYTATDGTTITGLAPLTNGDLVEVLAFTPLFGGALASTSDPGIVQLSNSISSTSEILAATPKAVKDAKDDAVSTAVSTAASTYLPLTQAPVLMPPGTVQFFAASSAPTGWLKANGALISRTTYANLFAAIGTAFGVGDGSTTFALPDLRGEFPRGWDDSRGIDSGRGFGSAQADAFASHSHGVTDPGHAHSLNYQVPTNIIDTDRGTLSSQFSIDNPVVPVTTASATGISIQNSGGTETRPRNIALLAIIKF